MNMRMEDPNLMDPLFAPVRNESEVESLLQELPVAVDRQHFMNFVLGFPRKYLVSTPRVEIVKHYFLLEGLGNQPVITSLAYEEDLWKLSVITRDRSFLFARITGTLSCFGMNIVSAEAFANANSMVLDRFRFMDREHFFTREGNKQVFRKFLEEVLEGRKDVETCLQPRWQELALPSHQSLDIRLENESHPTSTRLTLDCQDHFGLLYLVSRCISMAGYNIEMAYVQTPGQRVHDEFYLTHQGEKLTETMQDHLRNRLKNLADDFPAGFQRGERT